LSDGLPTAAATLTAEPRIEPSLGSFSVSTLKPWAFAGIVVFSIIGKYEYQMSARHV
jgi:hypothetical protein